MSELFEHALSPINLPLTILLAGVMGYWLLCLLGLLDIDFLDVSFGDGDGAVGGDGGGGDGPVLGVFQSALRFLNATDVPVMVVLTFLTVFLWGGSMLGNYYFNPDGSDLRAAVLIIPVLAVSLLLTRFATAPLRPLLRQMKNPPGETVYSVVGRVGTVRTVELTDRFGQVELLPPGPSLLLNARVAPDAEPLTKGTRVLVVDYDPETETYRVRPDSDLPVTPPVG